MKVDCRVTKFVPDGRGGLRLETQSYDPDNDIARVGQALHMRNRQEVPRDIYLLVWPDGHMCPYGLEIEERTVGVFLQSQIYSPSKGPESGKHIGIYERLSPLGDKQEMNEVVAYFF